MEWYYTSGGKITMSQQYRVENNYVVLSQQHATIDDPARARRRRRFLRRLPDQRPGASQPESTAMIETRRVSDLGRSASPEETRERILVATREVIGQ